MFNGDFYLCVRVQLKKFDFVITKSS